MKHLLITTIAAVVLVGCGPSEADKTLLDAASKGDIEAVKHHLAAGADVNMKKNDGWTPLHSAAFDGHKEIAELLIAKGADVNARSSPFGMTPLLGAAAGGHKEIVELLISKDADVNAKNKYGRTLLHFSAREGLKEVAEMLIAKGEDVNAKSDAKGGMGWTPLHRAALSGRNEVAELLIAEGADVNAKDKQYAETPLHLAAKKKKIDMVELLITSGADLNAKRNIALNSKDRLGATPLDHALTKKYYDIVDLLRKYGGRTGPEDIAYQFESINNIITQLQHLIIGDPGGVAPDKPSIEKLQGVFVIQGKVGGKYEVQYHSGDNNWQVREVVTLQSNRQLYIDSSSFDEKRFYRIKKID